jgi:DNA-directed RNA polymerase subunit RPC12/RpoP
VGTEIERSNMPDHRSSCRQCGTELEPGAAAADGWRDERCPTCGAALAVWRGEVPCTACGIEFPFEAAWGDATDVAARCPTCGSAVAVQRPPVHRPATALRFEDPAGVFLPALRLTPAPEVFHPALPLTPAPPPSPVREPDGGRRAASTIVALVGLLFVAACCMPTVRVPESGYEPGIICLLFGWLYCIAWLPNPLLLAGCSALVGGRYRRAFVEGVFACLCTLPLLMDRLELADLSWGYYFWQADIVLFTIAAGILYGAHGARVRRV